MNERIIIPTFDALRVLNSLLRILNRFLSSALVVAGHVLIVLYEWLVLYEAKELGFLQKLRGTSFLFGRYYSYSYSYSYSLILFYFFLILLWLLR